MSTVYPTHESFIQTRRVSLNTKRPPLRRSPSLPISNEIINKKSVRFCDNASLENVRLFLKTQMPKACRSDPTCPLQYTYKLRKTNWPTHKKPAAAVRLEDVHLDKTYIWGTCQVANLSFEKHIVVRYTLDDWTTIKQVDATYREPMPDSCNTWDRFEFKIPVRIHHQHQTICLAVQYKVNAREFWDNNNNQNYQLDIIPQVIADDQHQSSSSEDDDDDSNTFDNIEAEEEDLLINQLKPLSLANTKFTQPMQTPLSPPLSPTTPLDGPFWLQTSNKEYFDQQTHLAPVFSKPRRSSAPEFTTTPPV